MTETRNKISTLNSELQLPHRICFSCKGSVDLKDPLIIRRKDGKPAGVFLFDPHANTQEVSFCVGCCGNEKLISKVKELVSSTFENARTSNVTKRKSTGGQADYEKKSKLLFPTATVDLSKPDENISVQTQKDKNIRASNTSLYKGVSWHKRDQVYAARVRMNGKSTHIGNYRSELRAAIEVDRVISEGSMKQQKNKNFKSELERQILLTVLKSYEKYMNCPQQEGFENYKKMYENISKDLNGYPNRSREIIERMLHKLFFSY